MANNPIPTVAVRNLADGGTETIINVSDFDPATHEPADADATATLAAAGVLTEAPKASKPLASMTKEDLLELAAKAGVSIPANAVKADIVAALTAAGVA